MNTLAYNTWLSAMRAYTNAQLDMEEARDAKEHARLAVIHWEALVEKRAAWLAYVSTI